MRHLTVAACVLALAATDAATRSIRRHDLRRLFVSPAAAALDVPFLPFLREPFPLKPFSATDLDGHDVSPNTWRGKVTVVNFWATWCPPCRTEIPALVALQKTYRDRLLVVGVLQDSVSVATVRAFATSLGINYPIVWSTWAIESSFSPVLALPTTYVVDGTGQIVAGHAGLLDPGMIEREINAIASRHDSAAGGQFR